MRTENREMSDKRTLGVANGGAIAGFTGASPAPDVGQIDSRQRDPQWDKLSG
jgi:hypothetical protein